MTGCVEYFTANTIQSSVLLLNCRSFHSAWIFLCGFSHWNWPSSGKLFASVSKNLFLVMYRAVQVIWSYMGLLWFFRYQAVYQDSKIEHLYFLVLYCRHPVTSALQKAAFPCRGLWLTRTDQGMRWYMPVQWSSLHFKHSYCQDLDNVKSLVQSLVTCLTTIPFLVWRQIGAFPSFVYFTWEQMVHFPLSQLLWKVF